MSYPYDYPGVDFTHRTCGFADRGVSRAGFAMRLVLWTTLFGLAGGCGPEREGSVGWSIQFACSDQAARADKVVVAISEGNCPPVGRPVYQAAVLRGGGSSLAIPDDLAAGPYAFHADATDDKGAPVAQACMSITLPRSQSVELVLLGDGACQPAGGKPDRPGGHNSSRSDASVDLGDPDAGVGPRGSRDSGNGLGSVSGPRLETGRDAFLEGEPIPVAYADVDKAAEPFVALYREGEVKPTASFTVRFGHKEQVASGSHTFDSQEAGRYAVRLMYDTNRVEYEVMLTVLGDRDRDGTPDVSDGCPEDPGKVGPAACGCGHADTDTDRDGTADCVDGCPEDRLKPAPGTCGCGFLDSYRDQDSDGLSDCYDACPGDPTKVKPLQCGCGQADTDTDGDGAADCSDECVTDPLKVKKGACDCGVLDTDTDSDGVADCRDLCPSDPDKAKPGACGCGVLDTDQDGDRTADCQDSCPVDAGKTVPGICGCGVSDADRDGDGVRDCNDACPGDSWKTEPGLCGCGRADTDADGDKVVDCLDACPMDPVKREPLVCGCGFPDADTDRDGTLDCRDGCVTDPNKTSGGTCGCGHSEADSDSDRTPDCVDMCAADPNKAAPGLCGCGATEPVDVVNFRDAKNYTCGAWKGYDCWQATERYRYTAEQEASLLANCPKTCGVCP